ncbi:MAG: excinuclease ABC subunit UvrA [Planctomycetaceae bacterium]|nr:excinuclease ABC subunit UvrA [Planctomycetaceae bacterium]
MSDISDIVVKGAREHNLRNVNLVLPRNKLICFTGVSGSGKSSLAFDTLYAEGQRRYIESLSSYARQFLGQLPKPDADSITGLSPAISISQKTGGQSSRSTVGTITEIYDFLRVLFARVATPYCPHCGKPITTQTRQQIVENIITAVSSGGDLPPLSILAPVIRGQKGEHSNLFADLIRKGFLRARVDGSIVKLSDNLKLDRQMRHDIEVVVDKILLTDGGLPLSDRLAETVERALDIGDGTVIVNSEDETGVSPRRLTATFSTRYACPDCGISFDPPSPQLFSFNTPRGMCPMCNGLGEIHSFAPELLIPDTSKSFQQGCIEPVGKWRDMGRWKRHIFQGVAEALEKEYGLPAHCILETAWEELDEKIQKAILWGTGDKHIMFTWRAGASGHKWGGPYDGIIPKMLQQYRETNNKMQRMAMEKYMRTLPCGKCGGDRLNEQARSFKIAGISLNANSSLPQLCNLSIINLQTFFKKLDLTEPQQLIAAEALKEIRNRLGFLINVGLEYLSLGRTAPTLSGGEMQRIRLASQIGSGLTGVLYVLDEPSIGLHPRDNDKLLATLKRLRDLGNTVVVVEHDEDTMRAADMLVDFGPGPGVHGGEIVYVSDGIRSGENSLTLKYLNGEDEIPVPEQRRIQGGKPPLANNHKPLLANNKPANTLVIRKAAHNNLKNIDVSIPLGTFVCITGVSGSGKSSLVNDIIVEVLNRDLNNGYGNPGKHESIGGLEYLDKMIDIDQSPIGRGSHSNPATYIKLFDEIRSLYAEVPEAKIKGYSPGRFSFNVRGGRCEACEGKGTQKMEMDFLADVYIACPACQGKRFNHETLAVKYKGKNISQVLDMDVEEALEHFENIPKIKHYLEVLQRVGLDYMKLGQPSPTLSGGEAQRIKLAKELVKRSTGKTLYLLDEPTTGLHFADIKRLLAVLHEFVDAGNTVLVVEHNLDVIKTADWLIDLGPEGGEAGGEIICAGTPEDVMLCERSYTGQALKRMIQHKPEMVFPAVPQKRQQSAKQETHFPARNVITVKNAEEHNLKNVSLEVPREKMTVCCGPSGSGKSSMAMDTIYAEGQRRYVESLSSYARQFLGQLQKPKVEHIEGLSPAVAIEQKAASHSPRSTVGTITEIQDYLRVLFARLGTPYCPDCGIPIGTQTLDEIVEKITGSQPAARILITAPLNVEVGQLYDDVWKKYRDEGFARIRVDGIMYKLDNSAGAGPPDIDRRRKHDVELIVDRIVLQNDHSSRMRLTESVETALEIGNGVVHVIEVPNEQDSANTVFTAEQQYQWKRQIHSRHLACGKCGRSFETLTPHHFSANSPLGWCPHCEGLGTQRGANPAMFLNDAKLTLRQGAVKLLNGIMLESFCGQNGVPLDIPFDQLDARHKRLLYQGTGDAWYRVELIRDNEKLTMNHPALPAAGKAKPKKAETEKANCSLSLIHYQFKGLYPALEEAMRLVPPLRMQIDTSMMEDVECSACMGSRLRDDASAVRFIGLTLDQMNRMPLNKLLEVLQNWQPNETEKQVAGELLGEVKNRLQFLLDVGLDYLTLSRSAPTLSGGETQRIRLAAQIGSGLVGVLYVLDEPTIGLHPRDNAKLINALQKLRDLGNTLLVVEHDRDVIAAADKVLDFGPKAGQFGGELVAEGTPAQVAKKRKSVTGPYLSGKRGIPVPLNRRISASQAALCPVRK